MSGTGGSPEFWAEIDALEAERARNSNKYDQSYNCESAKQFGYEWFTVKAYADSGGDLILGGGTIHYEGLIWGEALKTLEAVGARGGIESSHKPGLICFMGIGWLDRCGNLAANAN